MKKLLLIATLLTSFCAAQAAQIVVNATTNGTYFLTTNRASVYSVTVISQYPAVISMYDADTLSAPIFGTNYTNLAWISRTYSNGPVVCNFVGYNGVTNWYTNAGIFTYTNTTAASTNVLPIMAAFAVGGGFAETYPVDALFTRGITATITTNASMIINYRSAQ